MITGAGKPGWRRHRLWAILLLRGEEAHWRPIFLVSYGFFAYALLSTILYFKFSNFERIVAWFDWSAVALEPFIPILSLYKTVLTGRNETEWLLLSRHIAVMSLVSIALQMFFYALYFRRHLRDVVTMTVAESNAGGRNESLEQFFWRCWLVVGLTVGLFYFLYFMELPLTTTARRARLLSDNYVRSLVIMPVFALVLGVMIPTSFAMLVSLFSRRLRAGLRQESSGKGTRYDWQ